MSYNKISRASRYRISRYRNTLVRAKKELGRASCELEGFEDVTRGAAQAYDILKLLIAVLDAARLEAA